jgi:putative membrane protein insertion efficiency factor
MTSIAAHVLIAPIRFYQRFITPYTPATCRYYPTCSAYAVTALRTRGAIVGSGLTIWRLLRCNPWSSGGVDHVPAKRRADDLHHHDLDPHNHGQDNDASAGRAPGSADDWAESSSADVDPGAADQEHTDIREREAPAGSSFPASPVDSHPAGTDLDAPHSAAPEPMIGRSAA